MYEVGVMIGAEGWEELMDVAHGAQGLDKAAVGGFEIGRAGDCVDSGRSRASLCAECRERKSGLWGRTSLSRGENIGRF